MHGFEEPADQLIEDDTQATVKLSQSERTQAKKYYVVWREIKLVRLARAAMLDLQSIRWSFFSLLPGFIEFKTIFLLESRLEYT